MKNIENKKTKKTKNVKSVILRQLAQSIPIQEIFHKKIKKEQISTQSRVILYKSEGKYQATVK